MKRKISKNQLADFWLESYANLHCTLCGNTGKINTIGRAITPIGQDVGRINWCICPNGQTMKKQNGTIFPLI